MKQRTLVGLALVLGGGLVVALRSGGASPVAGTHTATRYTNDQGDVQRAFAEVGTAGAAMRKHREAGSPDTVDDSDDDGTTFAVAGRVVDRRSADGVGDVEVVFANDEGEASAVTVADGAYSIRLPRGGYRMFVRSDKAVMLGEKPRDPFRMDFHVAIPGEPREDAMPAFRVVSDATGANLYVDLGGWIDGRVVDGAGRPIAGVLVNGAADSRMASLLGTDIDVTDTNGEFHLQVPAGASTLAINDPRYAGLANDTWVTVAPGEHVEATLVAFAGCRIRGHVVLADGSPARDGALEQTRDLASGSWGTSGHVLDDGSFDFAVTEEADVNLRAWPWKSPPSAPQTFACADGKVFDDVVFRLPGSGADLDGSIVDADGNPVSLTFLDIDPIDGASGPGINQIERTDVAGEFKVFAMPAGRYVITSHAPGRGVAAVEVTVPSHGVQVRLGGTGAVAGMIADADAVAAQFTATGCMVNGHGINLYEPLQVVSLQQGRFHVAGVPTCGALDFRLETDGALSELSGAIKRGETTTVVEIAAITD